MHVDHLGGRNNLFPGYGRIAKSNIVEYRSGEKKDNLEHYTDISAQHIQLIFFNTDIINLDSALLNMIKPIEQTDNRCFPAAGMPYNGNGLSCFHIEGDIFQYITIFYVSKGDFIEGDLTTDMIR